MAETMKSLSSVVLFGKVVEDLEVTETEIKADNKKSTKKPNLARIYGFSYEGAYYEMDTPTLLLVHGPGDRAMDEEVAGPGLDDDDNFYKSLKSWTYQRSDKTMRLDYDSGTIEQVLLQGLGDGGPGMSGARVSGARVSGARVSGARVSGARISGARLSGARGDASD